MILRIPWQIYEQIMAYARIAAPREITGLGTVVKITTPKGTNFRVKEIFLPEQKASSIDCELAEDAMPNLINSLLERENGNEEVSNLCFHWHSHADGPVFWSGIDEEDIRRWKGAYLISLVVNAQGNLLARLDVLEPIRIYNIPLKCSIKMPRNPSAELRYKGEVMEKVTFLKDLFPRKKVRQRREQTCQTIMTNH